MREIKRNWNGGKENGMGKGKGCIKGVYGVELSAGNDMKGMKKEMEWRKGKLNGNGME